MKKNKQLVHDHDYREKTLTKKEIFKGNILTLELHTVELPNGETSTRELIFHNGATAILAIKDDKFVLVKQYRKALDEVLLEIPAGKIEKDEDPKLCAIRELQEETGYHAKEVSFLMEMYPAAGYSSEKIYIYLATDLTMVGANPDDDEFLSITEISIEELHEKILCGDVKDSKTICSVLKYISLQNAKQVS